MPQVDLKVSGCHLFQFLRQLAAQGEVAIEGVESRCRFVSVVFEANRAASEGLAGPALPQRETHSAVYRTDHFLGSDEPVAPGADHRKRRRYSTGYIGEIVNHTRILVCHSKVAMKVVA
jgi:hypothetical protein